jgi:type VI secretion system secreted protein VgrG
MHLPHVGDEVVVSFLEGDPDRPLITGRVYNANNMPWEPLPGKQTTSYFRDVGGNHISMEEAKRIEMYTPEGETSLSLGTAEESPGICMSTELNYTAAVTGDENVRIDGGADRRVARDEKHETGGTFWKIVKGPSEELVQGPASIKYEGITFKFTAGASNSVSIGQKHDTFIGIQSTYNWDKKYEKTEKTVESKAGKVYTITAVNAGTSHAVFDKDGIKLHAGGTKIIISKDGGVVITAKGQVAISSQTTAKVIAKSGILLKAPKVTAIDGVFESKNIKDLG